MKKKASQKIRRNVLDKIVRVAAEGLRAGQASADILLEVLAAIHGEKPLTKTKLGRPKLKPGPKPKKGKPGPKPKKRRGRPPKLAGKKKAASKRRKTGTPPHGFVQQFVLKNLDSGKKTAQMLADIKVKYPNAKTSPNTINWYRSRLKKNRSI